MTLGESKKRPIWLAAATATVMAVILAAIVTLSVTGSNDESVSSAMPFNSVTPTPKPVVAPQVKVKTSPPKPTRPAKEQPAVTLSPEPAYTPPAQPAAEEPAPVVTRPQCPLGAVSAQLTSVGFEVGEPAWEGDTFIEVTVTAHGVFTNGTSAPVAVDNADIPNFLGLDDRGESPVMELYGTYDSPPPPPGEPSTGEFVLEPGASVVYTAVSDTYTDAIRKVKYWQADNDGYVLYYPFSELINCPVPFTAPTGARAIPNTFSR